MIKERRKDEQLRIADGGKGRKSCKQVGKKRKERREREDRNEDYRCVLLPNLGSGLALMSRS